jgi:hypothetical protein
VHCHAQPAGQGSGWDPVPHLAALIDGLHDLAVTAAQPDATNAGVVIALGGLLAGSYAALRGGLLLDEPGRENVSTEAALREALDEARRRP